MNAQVPGVDRHAWLTTAIHDLYALSDEELLVVGKVTTEEIEDLRSEDEAAHSDTYSDMHSDTSSSSS